MKPTCCDKQRLDSLRRRFVNAKPFSDGHILEPQKTADHLDATDSNLFAFARDVFLEQSGSRRRSRSIYVPVFASPPPSLVETIVAKSQLSKKDDTMSHLNRREWIGTTAIAGLSLTAAPSHSMATTMNGRNSHERVRIAIITDVHQDIMHDGEQRMQEFTKAIQKEDVDFAIQLGDFCVPKTENQKFLDLFHDLDMPCKHVLGNHDMDGGFRPEQTVEFYGMPSRYYSFDQGGVHFVVLDGNEAGGKKSGYKRFMGETQQAWLKEDLADTELPTMIFSHQPLNHDSGIENREEIQKILTQANSQQSKNNIIGCFSGHLHLNHLDLLKDIHYAQINSASYLWVGSEFIHES